MIKNSNKKTRFKFDRKQLKDDEIVNKNKFKNDPI